MVMALVKVWPAMLEPKVPARWLVKIVTEGRSARVGETALSLKSVRLDEKDGGISSSPYTFALSSCRRASSWVSTRMS